MELIGVGSTMEPRAGPTTKPKPTNPNAMGQVTTYAGTSAPGSADGPRHEASFGDPSGVADDQPLVRPGGQEAVRQVVPLPGVHRQQRQAGPEPSPGVRGGVGGHPLQ